MKSIKYECILNGVKVKTYKKYGTARSWLNSKKRGYIRSVGVEAPINLFNVIKVTITKTRLR